MSAIVILHVTLTHRRWCIVPYGRFLYILHRELVNEYCCGLQVNSKTSFTACDAIHHAVYVPYLSWSIPIIRDHCKSIVTIKIMFNGALIAGIIVTMSCIGLIMAGMLYEQRE